MYASNVIDFLLATRNKVVHWGLTCDALLLQHRVRRVSLEHRVAWNKKLQAPPLQDWISPPAGKVKVNVDVAIQEEYAVIAALARDSSGVLIGARAQKLKAVDVLKGKVEAARLDMKLVRSQGYHEVLLEGDSEIVIKAIQC